MKQMVMKLPSHGGKRKGAGRKPKNGGKAGVSHARRPQFKARHPVHVTMRLLSGVGYLRGYSRRRAIEDALRAVKLRFGMRVVHYSIQGTHLHLIVECDEPSALSRAIQGLAIRLARALNGLAGRTGKVFSDRFHSHVLESLRQVVHAVRYVLENFRHHLREDVAPEGVDPCSSAAWFGTPRADDAPVSPPRTWLLRQWRNRTARSRCNNLLEAAATAPSARRITSRLPSPARAAAPPATTEATSSLPGFATRSGVPWVHRGFACANAHMILRPIV